MLNRNERHAAIAQASGAQLNEIWGRVGLDPAFEMLRGPETGLVSLKGRIGGAGAPFPFGDATATRASVRLSDGRVGHALLLGRDKERATIAAVVDALCCEDGDAKHVDAHLIEPLLAEIESRDTNRAAQTAATRVDFFTMVRGED
ncbi:MAG: phosphonate C-P lyase system protein PhnG [Pseudomonadota bacterium]